MAAHAYRSAEKSGAWVTMVEAATMFGVTNQRIRRLIKDGILQSEQVVPGAPHQIRVSDLHHERVTAAIGRTDRRRRTGTEVVIEPALPGLLALGPAADAGLTFLPLGMPSVLGPDDDGRFGSKPGESGNDNLATFDRAVFAG
jgi:hypothetical protein